ncbi:hypothetical protein N505_0122835 [Rhodococcus aetherivorans]|nr:hypothetical protein N505_0122835 [Rhodococcus aetherivorans]
MRTPPRPSWETSSDPHQESGRPHDERRAARHRREPRHRPGDRSRSTSARTRRARLIANALHEGPPDSVHGGFSAHLLDCMLGILMQARGSRSLTASLDLRYLRRTSLDEPLDLYSRIVEIEGRKTVAGGWIECRGECTVEARGVFVRVEE